MKCHLISFDIPYPADYGGVIDVYHKIKTLNETGVHVILHCFQYRDRKAQTQLEEICEKVYYYPRNLTSFGILQALFSKKPFIVATRKSRKLLENLNKDNLPIIFEGLHTCFYIDNMQLQHRMKILRMHNVEWEYYKSLELLENSTFKRLYFRSESHKLKRFEIEAFRNAQHTLTISPDDQIYFQNLAENGQNSPNDEGSIHYIPPFHPNLQVESLAGKGNYALFHGKLSVSDNEKAALYLIEKVFAKSKFPLDIPFKIAGKSPSEKLKTAARLSENIEIISNPSESEIVSLIQNAQINILVSFQKSGMKLKLLNALFRGRFCVVNNNMVQNTGLEALCLQKNTSKDMRATVESLMNVQFSESQIAARKHILETDFSNARNARKIVEILRGG
jgi:hypothetical protein